MSQLENQIVSTIPKISNQEQNLRLPDAFLQFLKANEIDPSIYSFNNNVPRYIRVKPGCESEVPEIEKELRCDIERVSWLPGFYAMPPQVQIASTNAYKMGKIYGMDAASGAAVLALNVKPGDHILDLCAAPGAKLCMLADLLGSSGSLTGVDVARHRLAACRTMLLKYALGNQCRLFVADGTSFSLLPVRLDSRSCGSARSYSNMFKEWSSKRRWKERKEAAKLKKPDGSCQVLPTSEPELIFYGNNSGVVGLARSELYAAENNSHPSEFGYDKVLVDAECTHDGSIKHIHKFEYWGWETLQRRVLDAKRVENLMQLQLDLLNNGFRLLRAGGLLVYSTCSLTVGQNEDVVELFLSRNPSAEVQVIDAAGNWPCRSGRVPNSWRFDPITSQTSGLFVIKIMKLA